MMSICLQTQYKVDGFGFYSQRDSSKCHQKTHPARHISDISFSAVWSRFSSCKVKFPEVKHGV